MSAEAAQAKQRTVAAVVDSVRTLEGAGFEVRRPFPTARLAMIDPFLLLDEMGPAHYAPGEAKGAPDHPHRGFETVTYVLEGGVFHEDSVGNRGTIGPGDVQWMTAGAGVVHSEMPDPQLLREGGTLHGFQLWVNLPRRDKMAPPRYQEIPAEEIPEARTADGAVRVRVIAGEALGVSAVVDTHTPIAYQHWTLDEGGAAQQALPDDWAAFAYVFRGAAALGPDGRAVREGQVAILAEDGDTLALAGGAGGADLLLLAGRPLHEPVARYGPFVMNERHEIMQAIDDYRAGRLGAIER